MQRRTEIDFHKQVIDNLGDRFIWTRWLQPPGSFTHMTNALGILVKDPVAMAETIEQLQSAFPQRISRDHIGNTTIYRFGQRATDASAQTSPQGIRQPDPCLVILDDWVIVADSSRFLENIIRTGGGTMPQLTYDLDFEQVASELGLQLAGQKPFSISYTRVADELKQFYQLAKSDWVHQGLENSRQSRFVPDEENEGAMRRELTNDRSPTAQRWLDLLKRHPLPEFDELVKYFGPTGGFAYDEPRGLHYGWYTLRADSH